MRNWHLVRKQSREPDPRSPALRAIIDVLLGEFASFYLGMIVLTVGALVSAETRNWAWLGRSGCVLVVIRAIGTFANIEEGLKEKSRRHFGGRDSEAAIQEELRSAIRFRRQVWYTFVIAGNLIWGFADVLNGFYPLPPQPKATSAIRSVDSYGVAACATTSLSGLTIDDEPWQSSSAVRPATSAHTT